MGHTLEAIGLGNTGIALPWARLPKITSALTEKAMIRRLKPRRATVKSTALDNDLKFACHTGAAKAASAPVDVFDVFDVFDVRLMATRR